jgi:hypothetical protein
MSPVPFRHQPASRAVVLGVLLAATWIYDYVRGDDGRGSIAAAGLDLLLLGLLGLASLLVAAQFCLPVKTLPNRLRLAGRLWLHAWGAHGPVVFVQNGRRVERRGEDNQAGPGLLWVDTASTVVTRKEAGPRRVLDPGIHFTERREHIEQTFSLHTQECTIGPGQDDPIFKKPADGAGEEERARFEAAQVLRRAVSGLTRDGNEVIPEIRVTFRLHGQPAAPGQPGSRFGFSSDAVERASRSEGMNVDPVTARRVQVAWNQLPGLIAVDLWREYLAKFTLDDLFTARFEPVPEVLQPEEPARLSEPVPEPPLSPAGRMARLVWRLNNDLQRTTAATEGHDERGTESEPTSGSWGQHRRMMPGRQYTALQVIGYMVRARMTQAAIPILDECGRYASGHLLSEEFKRLRERGLRILDVTISGCRFAPAVEDQIVRQWRTAWLETAAGERVHVEQLEVLAAEAGRQRALVDHARSLGRAVLAEPGSSVPAALKALLLASHGEILTDERLHGRGSAELLAIAGLAKWLESPNDG